jgi:tRNA modification GTPase
MPVNEGMQIAVSTVTGEGLQALQAWIAERVSRDLSGADFPAVTRERHRLRLAEALQAVRSARRGLEAGPETAAEDLRRSASALARVTGAIDVEDVLGEVFASFCIGK